LHTSATSSWFSFSSIRTKR